MAYEEIFGTPALEEDPDAAFSGEGHPPSTPTQAEAKGAGYRSAFDLAFRFWMHPMALMAGIRSGLRDGYKAAREAGGGPEC